MAGLLGQIIIDMIHSSRQQDLMQQQQELEQQKNEREFHEKSILAPAIEHGDLDTLNQYEKVTKKYFSKETMDLMRKRAEFNQQDKVLQRNLNAMQSMMGVVNKQQGMPEAPAEQPMAPGPDFTPPRDMLRDGQPPRPGIKSVFGPRPDGSLPSAQEIVDYTNQNADDVQQALREGRSVQQVRDMRAGQQGAPAGAPAGVPSRPVSRLQPKVNATFDSKGGVSMNITPPTANEQEVHQAQFTGAMDWLNANPHVSQALGPQMMNRLRAGDPEAFKQVTKLQENPAVQPRAQDLLGAWKSSAQNPQGYRETLLKLFGDPKKAVEFEAMHPPGGMMDTNQLKGDVELETRTLLAEKGMPQSFATPEIVKEAQNRVLQKQADVRAQTSAQLLERQEKVGSNRAMNQAALQNSRVLLQKLPDDTKLVARANQAMRNIAEIGDIVYSGKPLTGFRPADAAVRQVLGYLQAGDKGSALAAVKGWAIDIAVAEQRMFGSSARMSQQVIMEQKGNVPDPTTDTKKTFNQKFLRFTELVNGQKKQMQANIDGAYKMLKANPYTADIADAVKQGHYDASLGYLKQLEKAQGAQPVPQINFGTGDFGVGGK